MKNDYANKLMKEHHLFKECVSCNFPIGYNPKIKQFVQWLETFNKKNNCDISVSQVKIKFGFLTIYVQDNIAREQPELHPVYGEETDMVHKVYEKIAALCYEVQKICNVCGKDLVESVYDSKIVWTCFDHPEENYIKFKRR